MTWIIFAIIAPALYAVSTYFDKFLISKKVRDPMLLTIITGITVFLGAFLIFLLNGFGTIPYWQILMLIGAGIMSEIALIPYYKAMSLDDASRIIPLFQIVPVLVLIFSYLFLGEMLSLNEFGGFVLILAGGFMLSLRELNLKIFKFRPAIGYVALTALFYAIPAITFKYVVITQNFWETMAYTFAGTFAGSVLLFWIYIKRFLVQFKEISSGTWLVVGSNELIYFFGNVSRFYAVSLGPIALVSVIGGTTPFFVLLFGLIISLWFPYIVKEDISKSTIGLKILATILIFLGAWLIGFGG